MDITALLTKPVFMAAAIIALGYGLGAVKIKGLHLGSAGVLIVALIWGIVCARVPELWPQAVKSGFSLFSSLGTALFITAVGLSAGPGFFRKLGRSGLPAAAIAISIVACGTLIIILICRLDSRVDAALGLGIMTGAMTSTPGFSAAMDSPLLSPDTLAAGYGIAYLFGVLGKDLFMQLLPRAIGADMAAEREKFLSSGGAEEHPISRKLIKIDPMGLFPFALTGALGLALGSIKIPGLNVALGASGGTLAAGILVGALGHAGPLDLRVPEKTLGFLREAGLVLFLLGSGVPGGIAFAEHVRPIYFLYGAALTLIPLALGYFMARRVFRLGLLQALGYISGGLTSTPALSALIDVSGTDKVVTAYAASYPIALICMVLAAKILPYIL